MKRRTDSQKGLLEALYRELKYSSALARDAEEPVMSARLSAMKCEVESILKQIEVMKIYE